jgi:hypothetical protein
MKRVPCSRQTSASVSFDRRFSTRCDSPSACRRQPAVSRTLRTALVRTHVHLARTRGSSCTSAAPAASRCAGVRDQRHAVGRDEIEIPFDQREARSGVHSALFPQSPDDAPRPPKAPAFGVVQGLRPWKLKAAEGHGCRLVVRIPTDDAEVAGKANCAALARRSDLAAAWLQREVCC